MHYNPRKEIETRMADIDPDVLHYDLKPAWMEEPVTR
jgi:hypothetical protein